MPSYDYDCTNCKNEWEDTLPISLMKKPLSDPCPKCGTIGYVRKIITKSNPVDPIRLNSGAKVDPGLRKTLDKMSQLYPGMQRNL